MTKKICLIGVYTALCALIIAVVLGAFIPKSFMPGLNKPFSIGIRAQNSTNVDLIDSNQNNSRFNDFYKQFEKAFNQNYLTAIFSGNIAFSQRVELMTSVPAYKDLVMTFTYSEPQNVKVNNKDYAYHTDTSKILKYTKVVFDLQKELAFTENYLYFVIEEEVNDVVKTNYYRMGFLANFDELYKSVLFNVEKA